MALRDWLDRWIRDDRLEGIEERLERGSNPILLKELRSIFRGKLFVGAHIALLLIIALWIGIGLLTAVNKSRWIDPQMPSETGRTLFLSLQWIQLTALFVLLPGVTATLISSERERRTLDILLSSAVRPARVLAGKLFCSLTLVMILVLSLAPVYLLTWIVGGITLGHALRFTLTALMVGTLLSTTTLAISALTRLAYQAIIGSYLGAGTLALLLVGLFRLFEAWGIGPEGATLWGFSYGSYDLPALWNLPPRVAWCALVFPLFCWMTLMTLGIVVSRVAITPRYSSRGAGLKGSVLMISALGPLVATGVAAWIAGPTRDLLTPMALTLLAWVSVIPLFASEEVTIGVEGSRLPRWAWPLSTGAQPGLTFALVSLLVVLFVFRISFALITQPDGAADAVLALVLGWGWFAAGLVYLLRVSMTGGVRTLYIAALLSLAGLPLIVEWIVAGDVGYSGGNFLFRPWIIGALVAASETGAGWAYGIAAGHFGLGTLCMLLSIPLLRRRKAALQIGVEPDARDA